MKKIIGIVSTLIIIIAVGVGAWIYIQKNPSIPPMQPAQAQSANNAKADTNKQKDKQEKRQVAEKKQEPLPVVAGNVGTLSELQAQIHEAELISRLIEIKNKSKPEPVFIPPTPIMPSTPLPSATQDVEAKQNTIPVLPNAIPMPQPMQQLAVVAVQGTENKLRATLRTSSGNLVTVHKGEKFNGGIIANISRQGVTLRKNNKNITLSFE